MDVTPKTPAESADSQVAEVDASRRSVRLVGRTAPTPGPGEVALRLRLCGLCGTDLFKLDHRLAPEGAVLGHELVGVIDTVGAQVAPTWQPGDRVVVPHHVACGDCPLCRRGAETMCRAFKENLFTPGGFAERLVVARRAVERAMWRIPDGIGDAAASFLEPAACVLRGIDRADLTDGDGQVVVQGAGSMGLLHLLVLRALAPSLGVIVVDPVEARRALALDLGATAAATPSAAAATTAEASGGLGADAVFDTVGGASLLRTGLDLLRPGGTVVLFAHAGDREAADFDLNSVFKSEKRVVATYSGSRSEQERIAELLFSGRLDPSPLVSHTMPLDELAGAIEMARRREALKILLVAP